MQLGCKDHHQASLLSMALCLFPSHINDIIVTGTRGWPRQHCLLPLEKGHAMPSWPAPMCSSCSSPGLGSTQPLFSLDACQSILALMDVSFLVCGRMHAAGRELHLEPGCLGVNPNPSVYQLGHLGQVTQPQSACRSTSTA